MIQEVEYAQYAITLVYSVKVHHSMNAYLVQILFLLKDNFHYHLAYALTNILMIPKINFASLAHLLVMLVRAIKINALNVLVVKIESYQDINVSAYHHTTNQVVQDAQNATVYVNNAH